MKTRVQKIVSAIKKPFGRKIPGDVPDTIVAAVREQRAFEIEHPIKFAHDQRVLAVLQRVEAKGMKLTPAVEKMTHQIVDTIFEWTT